MRTNLSALPGGNQILSGTGNGGLIRFLPKTSFTVPANSSAGTIQNFIAAKYIDSLNFVSGVLAVRIHALGSGTNGSFFVGLWGTSYEDEDPATDFVTDATFGSSTAAVKTGSISLATPNLVLASFTASAANPIPAQLRGVVSATAPTTGGALTFTISADLIARTSG